MAFVPSFDYDVFVSYAHADNEPPLAVKLDQGWVTTLTGNLNIGPNVAKKVIFIDHRLKPGDPFSEDLFAKVENSAILLIVLSQNYVDSAWCGQELEHFIKTHADDPQKPRDVFVAELAPFEAFSDVPETIRLLRKQLIHAKFWHQPLDAPAPRLAGFPYPDASTEDRHYWNVYNDLKNAIDTRLRGLRTKISQGKKAAPIRPLMDTGDLTTEPSDGAVSEPKPAILLADVTEDLEDKRQELKLALEKENIAIVPEGDYLGLSSDEFEQSIGSDLEQSLIFVQLLSPTVGKVHEGLSAPLPQLQYEKAKSSGKEILQWCAELPASGAIKDANHANLFQTPQIRAINLETFKTEIFNKYIYLYKTADASRAASVGRTPTPASSKKVVFVDDAHGLAGLNQDILAALQAQSFDVRSLPPDLPLGNNGVSVKDVLKICRAGVTIYSDRADKPRVFNRLVFFLNQIAEAGLPLARWGVLFGPNFASADVAAEFGVYSQDVVGISGAGSHWQDNLLKFLQGL